MGKIGGEEMLESKFSVYPVVESVEYHLNERLNEGMENAIRQIIRENYVEREHIPAIVHDYEMKLCVTDGTPFFCRPKQCSPAEKDVMQETIKDLLAKGTIRPSFSPYASRATFQGRS